MTVIANTADPIREKALQDYRKKLVEHRDIESRLKDGMVYPIDRHYHYHLPVIDHFIDHFINHSIIH